MAGRSGMYNANKRRKELMRKKKQEEKRLRRQKGAKTASQELEETDSMNTEPGSSVDIPEEKSE